jgi:FixJ family two-component response regulator
MAVLITTQRAVGGLAMARDEWGSQTWELNLSVKTIETHRSQLMNRLGIHDVAGLVRYAMRMLIIEPGT